MSRICAMLDLKDDPRLIEAYRVWHRPGGPPEAVIRSIRRAGVEAMEIYLSGNRLVMIMEVSASFSREDKARGDAADPEVQAWETLMSTFQQPLAWAEAGQKWVEAERIFSLADA